VTQCRSQEKIAVKKGDKVSKGALLLELEKDPDQPAI
jgi:multidrug efflux pump subunit AcrA (membrane-fusion protein)